ncbi:MAG TPA: hypothetical protein VGX96_04985 [Candidatus Elarobacter sp.]|jgi:hypothetical protein|nr:hypothetical protein [Candidatus Elarobacter sp.]
MKDLPSVLAETQSLTAVRGEVSDPDRGTAILAETHSLTEVRGEASDPDRGTFAETQTFTKVHNEANDADRDAIAGGVDWGRGDRRPLLFSRAVSATGEAPEIAYDDVLEMSVDESGRPLVVSGMAPETMTKTAIRGEADETDK